MNCSEVTERLSELIDGSLDNETEARVRAHLETCPDCRRQLCELEATVRLLNGLESVKVPPDLLPQIRSRLAQEHDTRGGVWKFLLTPQVRIAAAASLVLAICVYGYLLEGPGPSKTQSSHELGGDAAAVDSMHDLADDAARDASKAKDSAPPGHAEMMAKSAKTREIREESMLAMQEAGDAPAPSTTVPRKALSGKREAQSRDEATAVSPDRARGKAEADSGYVWGKSVDANRAGAEYKQVADAPAKEAEAPRRDSSEAGIVYYSESAPAAFFAAPAAGPASSRAAGSSSRASPAATARQSLLERSDARKEVPSPAGQVAEPDLTVATKEHARSVLAIMDRFAISKPKDARPALEEGRVESDEATAPDDRKESGSKGQSGDVYPVDCEVRIKAADYPAFVNELKTVGTVTAFGPRATKPSPAADVLTAAPSESPASILLRVRIVQE